MIDDTYDDNDNVSGKPINNVIDDANDDNNNDQKSINNGFMQSVGQQEGATGMMYDHKAVLCVQYSMPDLLDYLDSINSKPDPYSNEQWNQSNHHDHLKQDQHNWRKQWKKFDHTDKNK